MKIAVIDDSAEDRKLLAEKIQNFCLRESLIYEIRSFSSGNEFLQASRADWDIIFLDIFMNEIDGMTLARTLRGNNVHSLIVFTTSSRDYAIESYDVRAFHYLVKPIPQDKLDEVLRLSEKSIRSRNHYIEVKEGRDHGPCFNPGHHVYRLLQSLHSNSYAQPDDQDLYVLCGIFTAAFKIQTVHQSLPQLYDQYGLCPADG